jgi:hypothetical protein
MTEPLSPAAQAVLDAFNKDEAGVFVDYGDKLAAALKAAANDWRVDTEFIGGVEYIRASTLKRIAAELEADNE